MHPARQLKDRRERFQALGRRLFRRGCVAMNRFPSAVATAIVLSVAAIVAAMLLSHGETLQPIAPPSPRCSQLPPAAIAAYYSWVTAAVALMAIQLTYASYCWMFCKGILTSGELRISAALLAFTLAPAFALSLGAAEVTYLIEPATAHRLLHCAAALDIIGFVWARMAIDLLAARYRRSGASIARDRASRFWRVQVRMESAWLTVAVVQLSLNYRMSVLAERGRAVDTNNLSELIVAIGGLFSVILAVGYFVPKLVHGISVESADSIRLGAGEGSLIQRIASPLGRWLEIAAPTLGSLVVALLGSG